MKQFLLPDDFNGETSYTLTGDDYHYLCHVLRKKEGQTMAGLDKNGQKWQITINHIDEESCMLHLSEDERILEQPAEITLAQCLPKGKKMDLIIRQAIEAGVKRIIPIMSDHAVPRFDNQKDMDKKRDRWEKVAREAMQQSGSLILPIIESPIKMDLIPHFWKERGPGLFCHQERIDDNSLHKYLNEAPSEICLVIGPEGGLSNREIQLLRESDFKPLHFGDNVLRTETAALFATAAVKVIMLENETWKLN